MPVTTERNLLFGVLAVQLKLATPQQLMDAAGVWAVKQERDLGELLVEQSVISERQRQLIAALINEQTGAYEGDAAKVLASFGGDASVQASFGGQLVFDRASRSLSFAPLGGSMQSVPVSPSQGGGKEEGSADWLTIEQPGRYTFRGEQGRGGIGRVLIAFDEYIGREIALKELLPEGGSAGNSGGGGPMRRSATLTARFLREARITGQLEHPGIVPVYELGRHPDGSTYYTMKLVRGQTLGHRLKECRTLSERLRLLPHFLDLCQAIAYAHSREVIHRDIKPGNVMVGEFGETVLLDWGLAKVHGHTDEGAEKLADEVRLLKDADADQSVDGKPIGTPSYMPPEQADGRIAEVDERSDVWSLGAVLYEILTGRPPFVGSTAFEVIGMVLTDEVQPVLDICKEAPPELAAIAMRCLQRDPKERYQRVEQLAADAVAFQTGGLVGAYSYNLSKILRRWVQKRWPVLATAGVALLILITIGTIAYTQVFRQNQALQTANKALDQSKDELLAFKLATESNQAAAQNRTELASLLALEAANHHVKAKTWMPEAASSLRGCAGAQFFCRELVGHASQVRRIAFSRDGKMLASCGNDQTVRLWDLTGSGAATRVLRGHSAAVSSVAFSPDGLFMASASHDGTLRIWDLSTDTTVRVLEGHEEPVWAVAFSTDGKMLASGGVDRKVLLWDLTDPESRPLALEGQERAVQDVLFTPDGKSLISCSTDNELWFWSLADLGEGPQRMQTGLPAPMWMTFSADGKRLAVAGLDKVLIWNYADLSAAPLALNSRGGLTTCAFSPDGSLVASGGTDNLIHMWNLNTPAAEPKVLNGQGTVVWSVAFSADGNAMASSSGERNVRLWDLQARPFSPKVLSGHTDIVRSVAYNPAGTMLATSSRDKTIRLWNLSEPHAAPTVLNGHEGQISAVAYSPDGKRLASASWDKTVRVWDLSTDPPVATILTQHKDKVRCVAINPDGREMVSCSDDMTILAWDLSDLTKQPRTLVTADEAFLYLAYSADGRMLAAGDSGKDVWLWGLGGDMNAPPTLLHGLEDSALTVGFSPDGQRLAAAGMDQTVRIWDLRRPDDKPIVLRGHSREVYSLAFSRDGRLLASGSFDATVRLWNLELFGSEPEVIDQLSGTIFGIAFSPDGRDFVNATASGNTYIYPVDSIDLLDGLRRLPWRNLTLTEWNKFVSPDIQYSPTISELPPGIGAPGGAPLDEARLTDTSH